MTTGGGDNNVDMVSSPEQQNLARMWSPFLEGITSFGQGQMYPGSQMYRGGQTFPYYYANDPNNPMWDAQPPDGNQTQPGGGTQQPGYNPYGADPNESPQGTDPTYQTMTGATPSSMQNLNVSPGGGGSGNLGINPSATGATDPSGYWNPVDMASQLWNIPNPGQYANYGNTPTQPGSLYGQTMGNQYNLNPQNQIMNNPYINATAGFNSDPYSQQMRGNPFINDMANFSSDPYAQQMMGNPFIPAMQGLDPSGMAATGGQHWSSLAGDAVVPTTDYRQNLDPDIRAAIRDPYERGGEQLLENYLGRGQLGGVTAAGLGEYWSGAEKNIAQQEWDMTAPGMQNYQDRLYGLGSGFAGQQYGQMLGLGGDLGRMTGSMPVSQYNQTLGLGGYSGQLAAQMPYNQYNTVLGMGSQGYGDWNQAGQNYANQMYGGLQADWGLGAQQQQQEFGLGAEQWRQNIGMNQYPFTMIPAMMGGTYSTPVVQQGGGGNWMNPLMTGGGTALGAYGLGLIP